MAAAVSGFVASDHDGADAHDAKLRDSLAHATLYDVFSNE